MKVVLLLLSLIPEASSAASFEQRAFERLEHEVWERSSVEDRAESLAFYRAEIQREGWVLKFGDECQQSIGMDLPNLTLCRAAFPAMARIGGTGGVE